MRNIRFDKPDMQDEIGEGFGQTRKTIGKKIDQKNIKMNSQDTKCHIKIQHENRTDNK